VATATAATSFEHRRPVPLPVGAVFDNQFTGGIVAKHLGGHVGDPAG